MEFTLTRDKRVEDIVLWSTLGVLLVLLVLILPIGLIAKLLFGQP